MTRTTPEQPAIPQTFRPSKTAPHSPDTPTVAQSGFTLIELLVAISILALIVMALSLVPSLQLGGRNNVRTYAANAAREAIEAYRSVWSFKYGFEQGLTPTTLKTTLENGCALNPAVINDYSLALNAATEQYEMQPTPAGSVPELRRISVTVRCQGQPDLTLTTDIGHPQPEIN